MLKKASIISILGLLLLFTAGCKDIFQQQKTKIKREQTVTKEVKIFIIGEDQPELEFKTDGQLTSANFAYISSEIIGKINKIHVQIGEQVKKGAPLISLGDSLNTELIELNYNTAQSANNLTNQAQDLTQQNTANTLEMAYLQSNTALKNYQNSLKTIKNANKIFKGQLEIAQIEVDNAEKAYKTAKKSYFDSKDIYQDTEEDYEDLLENTEDFFDKFENFEQYSPPEHQDYDEKISQGLEKQLNKDLKSKEIQLENAKLNMQIAKNRLKQAEQGLENLKINYKAEFDQLRFAREVAYNQYLASVSQYEGADIATQLQQLQADGDVLKSQNNLQTAKLASDHKIIKSPIDGKITTILAEEGNLTTPGQILLKIENNQLLSIKTSLNAEQANLLQAGDPVKVEIGEDFDAKIINAYINTLNPMANEISKKFDIEILIPNPQNIKLAGLAKIYFPIKTKNKIFIPLNSLSIEENQNFVHLVDENNLIRIISINTGSIIGDYIEIFSGLKFGDQIITSKSWFLKEGEKVKIKAKPIKR